MVEVKKIAVLYDPQKYEVLSEMKEQHKEWIRQVVPDVEIVYAKNEAMLMEQTTDADILITTLSDVAVNFCKGAKSLKWVHNLFAGMDIIMNSEIAKTNVRLTRTKGTHGSPMSDTTLAFIFSFLRVIPTLIRQQDRKEWIKHVWAEEMIDKTIGIIGFGAIGEEVARKCKLLGFRVIATKRKPIQSPWVDEMYPASGLETVMKESDFVVVTIPSTPATAKYIGEKELRMMKKTAYYINIARGAVTDEEALVNVLQEGAIAGAGLDVFAVEPLPQDSPLWDMHNVIISPHMSADSPYYMDRAFKYFSENLWKFINGEEMMNEIDKSVGY